MLATLDQVKGKLDLPETDTLRNDALLLVLQSASERVLDLGRYVEDDDAADRVEVHENVRTGKAFTLEKRLVQPAAEGIPFTVEGKKFGAEEWTALDAELVNAARGRVVIVSTSFPTWHPRRRTRPSRVWPLVRVTYRAAGITDSPPAGVVDATAALAAYWYDRHVSGAASDLAIGPIRKKIMSDGIPDWISASLGDHGDAEVGAAWF